MKYYSRIIDQVIENRTKAFNAINIIGPKGCGKTRTCAERCKTIIEFQDEEKRLGFLQIADTAPKLFFSNEKPILFDEWQDAPKIWGAIRKDCDDHPKELGSYYLTGSTSKDIKTPHTGTGRISSIKMFPMTLWESQESNGQISLIDLFNHHSLVNTKNPIKLEDYFYILCRGGWPRCISIESVEGKLEIAKDYFQQIYEKDINTVDNVKRNPSIARTLIKSYARNVATLAKKSVIYADVKATQSVSEPTLADYVSALEKLFVIYDVDAWMPQLRSKTSIRSSKKHIFYDTSIATAALGISPNYFNNDLDLFGHLFENLVIRDLLVFAQAHDAHVLHYKDDSGLEADAVFELEDGRYALIEIKTGTNAIPYAEENLLRFKNLIQEHNKKVFINKDHPGVTYREPDLLIIICANAPMAYETENGVKVIPFACLKD